MSERATAHDDLLWPLAMLPLHPRHCRLASMVLEQRWTATEYFDQRHGHVLLQNLAGLQQFQR
jgi:hypothetical protein